VFIAYLAFLQITLIKIYLQITRASTSPGLEMSSREMFSRSLSLSRLEATDSGWYSITIPGGNLVAWSYKCCAAASRFPFLRLSQTCTIVFFDCRLFPLFSSLLRLTPSPCLASVSSLSNESPLYFAYRWYLCGRQDSFSSADPVSFFSLRPLILTGPCS